MAVVPVARQALNACLRCSHTWQGNDVASTLWALGQLGIQPSLLQRDQLLARQAVVWAGGWPALWPCFIVGACISVPPHCSRNAVRLPACLYCC